MWNDRAAPALGPAVGLVLGTCLAPLLGSVPGGSLIFAAGLLAALGMALGRRAGFLVAAFALGLLSGEARLVSPAAERAELDLERPLVVVGRVSAHPVVDEGELLLRLETEHLVQDDRPRRGGIEVFVSLKIDDERPPPTVGLGSRLRLKGYLRRSQGYANGSDGGPGSKRPGAWRLRLPSVRFLAVEAPPGPVARLAGGWRRGAEAALGRAPESAGARLARALVLGDRGALNDAWSQALRRLGLSHLLAVSGLHVGLVALLALALASPLPRAGRYALALVAVALYLALVGPRPAVLRAAAMALLALGALLLERPPQGLNALSVGVFLLVLERPAMVADLGFQLSAAATAGMIVLAPRFVARWTLLPFFLRRPLAATAAAQIAALPFLVPLTGALHPLAVFYNLVAVPWLGLFLLAALPWVTLAALWPAAAAFCRPGLDLLALPLEGLASLPPTAFDLRLVALSPALATVLALALAAWGVWPRRLSPLLLGALVLSLGPRPAVPGSELMLLDVGQGDAMVLRDGRHSVLIDGGGWPRGDFAARVLLPALAAAGVDRLDAVALSHADLDHCGGLAGVVRYLPVAEIWTAPLVGEERASGCAARLLAAPGPRHQELLAGDALAVGGWRLEVLHPRPGDRERRRVGDNDRSLVLLVSRGPHRLLLTGDLEAAGERLLVRRYGVGLRAGVFKVAHHGSRSSSSAAFLDAVAPRLALVSAGARNPYGHPAQAVLERLEGRGIRALRSDRSGRVVLRFMEDEDGAARLGIALPAAPR